jgi:hypothetical protein
MSDSEGLSWLRELHEWMTQHTQAEFAALVAKMSPEERVRIRAHMSVLKDWLAEFKENLPPKD